MSIIDILSAPIDWRETAVNPDLHGFLSDLQANILKSHGRHHAAHIFITFAGMAETDVADIVRTLGHRCTSALDQLRNNKNEAPHLDGGPVRCLFLAASGYKALGLATMPEGPAFKAGMEASKDELSDPPRTDWEQSNWRDKKPDAMFLLADQCSDRVTADIEDAEGWLNGTGATVLFIERGLQQTRSFQKDKPEGVEHFGYVDGRSQPLFLVDAIAKELLPTDPAHEPKREENPWNPAFPPSQVVVPDPNRPGTLSAGSYFVFRKLEQNVKGFNAAEAAIAKGLFGETASQEQKDRAGAMIVGRFEDGTPLVLRPGETKRDVRNDFSYAGDPDGLLCPFHAHIRKVNPRGDIKRTFSTKDDSAERAPIMARRGITYGPERPHKNDDVDFGDEGVEPTKDVGLLFMAYVSDIEAQFEFTQKKWANNSSFVKKTTGIDPVIGQGPISGRRYVFQDGWTGGAAKTLSFDQFVTMMGGEYFFAPSLTFLRTIGL